MNERKEIFDDPTDREKSVLLARVMGWQIDDPTEPMDWRDENGEGVPMALVANIMRKGYELGFSFYDPANMALARRVRIWALTEAPEILRDTMWDYAASCWQEWIIAPDDRPWLDAIVQTLIEAKIVEAET
jgi:hypothetical protein